MLKKRRPGHGAVFFVGLSQPLLYAAENRVAAPGWHTEPMSVGK